MFRIELTDDALEDLKHLKKRDQKIVMDALPDRLAHEPLKESRNRKPLRPNQLSSWQLRIGAFRVFYDVSPDSAVVLIKAVGWKEHNRLFIRGQEFTL